MINRHARNTFMFEIEMEFRKKTDVIYVVDIFAFVVVEVVDRYLCNLLLLICLPMLLML